MKDGGFVGNLLRRSDYEKIYCDDNGSGVDGRVEC